MTQTTARTTFTKTVTYTFTADFPNQPGASAATLLAAGGGATPTAGSMLSLGELLAKSTVAFAGNGAVSGAWSAGAPSYVEPYTLYTPGLLETVGDHVSPTFPTNRLYVCTVAGTTTTEPVTAVAATALVASTVYTITSAGTTTLAQWQAAGASGMAVGLIFTATANTVGTGTCSTSAWPTTVGATIVNGCTYMTVDKFAVVAALATTTAITYTVGVLFRNSTAEFLVTTGGLAVAGTSLATTTPIGGTVVSGAATFTRVA